MSTTWVILTYGSAAVLALLLLFFARAKAWYWHILSILAALVIGLVPIPPRFNSFQATLVVGFVFTFLILWGIAAPLFRRRQQSL